MPSDSPNQIDQEGPTRVTPGHIRDILNLKKNDPFVIFEIITSNVEQPNFQEWVDDLIDVIDQRLADQDAENTDIDPRGLIDNVRIDGSNQVREAILSLGTSIGDWPFLIFLSNALISDYMTFSSPWTIIMKKIEQGSTNYQNTYPLQIFRHHRHSTSETMYEECSFHPGKSLPQALAELELQQKR